MVDKNVVTQALSRTLISSAAVVAAGFTTVALTEFEEAARGPLSDLEVLARDYVEHFGRRGPSSAALDARRRAVPVAPARDLSALKTGADPLIGIWDPGIATSFERWQELERKFDTRFDLVGHYIGWSRRRSGGFPAEVLRTISDAGSVAVLTWEPWVHALDESAAADGRDSLRDIAGGRYDAYVDAFAADAASFARPIFMRFAHEMNDPYRYPWGPAVGNQPEDFIAAFRHVRERFAAARASNVLWIFAPSIAYSDFEKYYPGPDAVDWVATAVLNYGTMARWSKWWSFDELLAPRYPDLARLGHPIMLAETSSTRQGGQAWEWYDRARLSLAKFPAVRGLVLFHDANDRTLGTHSVDFGADDDVTRPAVASLLRAFRSPKSFADTLSSKPE